MPNRQLEPACLQKSNEECHNNAIGIWGELEQDDVKELKDFIDKWVKAKKSPCF